MKTWACLLSLLLCASLRAAEPVQFPVKLDEPTNRYPESIRWPVTVGVPFGAGAIDDQTVLRLLDGQGQAVDLQTKVVGRWLPKPGTPQWVLLDFQADLGGKAPQSWVVQAGGKANGAPSKAIQIKETEEKIAVDTGAVSFAVDKKHFNLFDTFKSGQGEVLDGSAIYWVDEQGRRYEARMDLQPKVEVETAGPMRTVIKAEGWYAPVEGLAGGPMMKYQVRITAFAGLPYVRIYHTLIWTEDASVKMKEWGLSFHLARPAAEGKVGMEAGEPMTGSLEKGPLEAVQDTYGKLPRLSGWAQAGGLGVSVADMSMQLPKAYTIHRDRVDVQLWAPQAGPLSMEEKDRMISPDIPAEQREWLLNNGTTDPKGVAKTHEVWVWPTGGKTPGAEVVNDYVQRPVVAMADAVYQCSTEAMPGLRAASETPAQYRYIEDGLDAMFDYIALPEDRLKDFSTFTFGDVHLFSQAAWRGYDGNGYNWSQTPWRMFYRSGGRKYFMHGVRNARYVMDIFICHFAPEKAPDNAKILGAKYMYSPLPWGWGPFVDNFHTHPQYLLHYYHLTGYERAADVLNEMARASKLNVLSPDPEDWKKRGAGVSRSQYGKINPACVYYEFTGDSYFLDQAVRWAQVAIDARDKEGVFPPITFWNFFHRGLWNASRLSGKPEFNDALINLVRDFSKPPSDALTAPWWGRDGMLAFDVAYRATKNDYYLDYPIRRVMDEMSLMDTQGRVTPWKGGRGSMSMQRNEYPQFFDGVFELMGAWHDANFKPVGPWLGNNFFFGSRVTDRDGFKSIMTLYVKKDANKGGKVALLCQDSNWSPYEQASTQVKVKDKETGKETVRETARKMEALITGPDGSSRTVPVVLKLLQQPDPILFDAGLPGGVYKIEILGEQQLFWIAPKTDLAGLVVELPDRMVNFKAREDPARVYFKVTKKYNEIVIKPFGKREGVNLPLRLAGPGDVTLGVYPYPGPVRMEFPLAKELRDKPLSLVKAYMDYVPLDLNMIGVTVDGAQPYFAVQPDQWFAPVEEQ